MAKIRSTGTTVSLSTSSNINGADLAPGEYLVSSSVDCHFIQGDENVTATTGCAQLGKLPNALQLTFSDDCTRIAAITETGTGTLYIHRLEGES